MKTLTIGSTTLEIDSFDKIRDKVVGVYAEIKIPKTAISRDDVWTLFDDNPHELIVTEEDGSTTTYKGYSELEEVKENKDYFILTQICSSEAMHLLNEARKKIETLEREKGELQNELLAQSKELQTHAVVIKAQNEQIVVQGNTIMEQGNAIAEHQTTISEQTEQITEHTAQVANLEERSLAQLMSIDSLLTNVVPAIMELAVTRAVEAVTAMGTTGDEPAVIEK